MRDTTESTDKDFGSDRGKTFDSTTGVDLQHPPRSIDNLADIDKRFLAGMVRESYVQGLTECRRNPGSQLSRETSFKLADQWIGSSIPFLAGVIGDVSTNQSNR